MVVGSYDGRRLVSPTWHGGAARLARLLIVGSLLGAWGLAFTAVTPTVALAQDDDAAAGEPEPEAQPEGYLSFLVKALGNHLALITSTNLKS